MAIHFAETCLLEIGDNIRKSDEDHAMAKDAEMLAVTDSDTIRARQEKEARTVGGMLSR